MISRHKPKVDKGVRTILVTRFIFKELFMQFLSQFVIISAVVTISQLTKLVKKLTTFGVTAENFLLPFLYTLIPFFSIIIPLAFLIATLIVFARLSTDGELAALLASGTSLLRLAQPVLVFGLLISLIGTASSLYLEPWAHQRLRLFMYEKAQSQLDNFIKVQLKPGVFNDGFFDYIFYTEKIDSTKTRLENVLIAPGHKQQDQNFSIYAPVGSLRGTVSTGDLTLTLSQGTIYSYPKDNDNLSIIKFGNMELDLLHMFKQQIFQNGKFKRHYETLSFPQLRKYITQTKTEWRQAQSGPSIDKKALRKLRRKYQKSHFLLQQRYSTSFLALAFGIFGMFFGIQNQRSGKSSAYAGVILTITFSYAALSAAKWLGQGGNAPATLASWLPATVALLVSGYLLFRRHRRPLSEPLFTKL